jgi:hypothetical protein
VSVGDAIGRIASFIDLHPPSSSNTFIDHLAHRE